MIKKEKHRVIFIFSSDKKPANSSLLFFLKELYEFSFVSSKTFDMKSLDKEDIVLTDDLQLLVNEKVRTACFKLLYTDLESPLKLYEGKSVNEELPSGKDLELKAELPALFQYFEKERHLTIRKATESDMLTYFHWANDPIVRNNAIHKEPIALENHKQWFMKRLSNQNAHLFIFEKESTPLGQVRFDKSDLEYEIDYSIDQEYRGEGYGRIILFKAIQKLLQTDSLRPLVINALVKISNSASNRVFRSLRFEENNEIKIGEYLYCKYQWRIG